MSQMYKMLIERSKFYYNIIYKCFNKMLHFSEYMIYLSLHVKNRIFIIHHWYQKSFMISKCYYCLSVNIDRNEFFIDKKKMRRQEQKYEYILLNLICYWFATIKNTRLTTIICSNLLCLLSRDFFWLHWLFFMLQTLSKKWCKKRNLYETIFSMKFVENIVYNFLIF